MKPVTVAEWIAALRSGNYKQAKRSLHGPNRTFCCLGVGADLGGAEWRRERGTWVMDEANLREGQMLAPCHTALLGELGQFLEWTPANADRYVGAAFTNVKHDLAKRNDDGWTFEQIADRAEHFYAEWQRMKENAGQ